MIVKMCPTMAEREKKKAENVTSDWSEVALRCQHKYLLESCSQTNSNVSIQ